MRPIYWHLKGTAPNTRSVRFIYVSYFHGVLDTQGTSASANNALRALCEGVRQCAEAGVLDDAIRLAESVTTTVFQVLGLFKFSRRMLASTVLVSALVSLSRMHAWHTTRTVWTED